MLAMIIPKHYCFLLHCPYSATTFLFDHRFKFFLSSKAKFTGYCIKEECALDGVLVASLRLFFIDEISGCLPLKDEKGSILSHFKSCSRMDLFWERLPMAPTVFDLKLLCD